MCIGWLLGCYFGSRWLLLSFLQCRSMYFCCCFVLFCWGKLDCFLKVVNMSKLLPLISLSSQPVMPSLYLIAIDYFIGLVLKRDNSDPNTKNIYPVCMCLSHLVGQLFDVCWLTQADVFYSLFGSGSVAVGWLRYALCLESPPGGVSSVLVYCKHLATWNAWTIIRRMEKWSRTKRMSPGSVSTIKKKTN